MRPPKPRRSGLIALAAASVAAVAIAAAGCMSDSEEPAPGGTAELRPLGPGQDDAPNIVLVLTDDQEAESVAAMPIVQRELAAEGTSFSNFYATFPECCPSRASFLTGLYAHNHGVLSNEPPDGGFGAFEDDDTLPVWLHGAGYRTAYIGKYLNGYGWDALGNSPKYVPPGWTDWAALVNHTEYQMFGYDLNIDGRIRSFGSEPADYQTDVLARLGTRFISHASGRRPFLLVVAPLAPHDEGVLEGAGNVPRNPRPAARHAGSFEDAELPQPPSFDEGDVADKPAFVREERPLTRAYVEKLTTLYRSRLESLQAVDELVGDLIDSLETADELDSTIVAYSSDNGFLLGQHRLKGKNVVYEESARVPLVVRGPGFRAGATDEALAGNIDFAATVADAAGLVPASALDGVSLLEGGPDRGGRSLLLEVLDEDRFAAVRRGRYVYARYRDGEEELYDLEVDPYQLANLADAASYTGVRRKLRAELDRLERCAGAGCR